MPVTLDPFTDIIEVGWNNITHLAYLVTMGWQGDGDGLPPVGTPTVTYPTTADIPANHSGTFLVYSQYQPTVVTKFYRRNDEWLGAVGVIGGLSSLLADAPWRFDFADFEYHSTNNPTLSLGPPFPRFDPASGSGSGIPVPDVAFGEFVLGTAAGMSTLARPYVGAPYFAEVIFPPASGWLAEFGPTPDSIALQSLILPTLTYKGGTFVPIGTKTSDEIEDGTPAPLHLWVLCERQ